MSEFECSRGHMPVPHEMIKGRCPCGAPIVRMDGKSSRRLAYEERETEQEILEEKEERSDVPY